jgi:hypothetical protein
MHIRSINSIAIILGLSLVGHGAIAEESYLPLAMGRPIVEANSALIAQGWRPYSEQVPQNFDIKLSGLNLPSLRSCSATGMGFCRYDYRRNGKYLSVVTIPSATSRLSSGIVERWW